MANLITLIAAVITCTGTVAAAVITTRRSGPAGQPEIITGTTQGTVLAAGRTSRSFWLGLAGLVAWIIPVIGYCVVIPGLYIAIREQNGPRQKTAAGLVLCVTGLVLCIINSAIGAWQGAHGVGWWQG